ncbi:hypothetical protein [Campylobacter molothri]|uniref:hypothetical protein n=1 Tax=Campylobacter molothri TaxID=1032242 RepID=UPI00301DD0CB|nr:hypothetical protein [Campylobacter sp. RM10542]
MKEKLFISVRDDGVGTRLLSLLNAMYLADKFYDIKNMRFFWNDEIVLFNNYYINNNSRQFENCDIIGQSVGKVESIFNSNFIKKHYLENKYLYNTNMAYSNKYSYPNYTVDLLKIGFNKTYTFLLDQILNNKYIYIHHHNLSLQFYGIESNDRYKNKLKEMWAYIDFIPCLKQQILNANQKSSSLDKFIVIHIRSGDIIYNYSNARKFNLEGIYHATPLELAAAIMAKNKYDNIVIVGDDLTSTLMLKDMFNSNRIFHISDFRDNGLSNLELLIFDLIFMSNSSKIYGTHSALVILSSILGKNKIFQNSYSVFNEQYQYQYFKKYNTFFLQAHNSQKAFSLFHMYLLSSKNKDPYDVSIKYLKQALVYDLDNDKYRIHILHILLQNGKLDIVERYLKIILYYRKDIFLSTLFSVSWSGYVYLNIFSSFLDYSQKIYKIKYLYPNIFYIVNEVIKLNLFAVFLIKQHLSYKLGKRIMETKSILDIIKLPLDLKNIIDFHKKNQSISVGTKIEDCLDYNEALKFKEHLSYKLGKVLINAHRNWYKGGYIKLIFDIIKLKKEFQRKNKK